MFSPQNIRVVSDEERQLYEQQLYPLQDQVCRLVGTEGLYLSGGTALSRVYFQHRYSDDLDFFFNGSRFDQNHFVVEVQQSVQRIAEQYQVESLISGDYFRRILVKKQQTILKVEFIYDPHPHIGTCSPWNGCLVDSMVNIGVNKITAVQDRKTVKDFVDLYFLLQRLELEQLVQESQKKIVPLDYENAVLAFSDRHLEGTALMIKPLGPEEMNRFGQELVSKLIAYARAI